MKRTLRGISVGIILQALTVTASACPECRAQVKGGVYNQDFPANLFVLLLPIIVLLAIGVGLYFADGITKRLKEELSRWRAKEPAVR
ncbi:MAG TPA: hypothetical protein VGB98_18585 [Pyrinomonadaceae bacterium]|jgi:hypothetical protein